MSGPKSLAWTEANQSHLCTALDRVRHALGAHAGMPEPDDGRAGSRGSDGAEAMEAPAALERVCSAFGLSAFERDVLLLCAGAELDARFAELCAAASGDARRPWPTFGLALAAFPRAHWSALAPLRPLRAWHLVEIDRRDGLTRSRLHIDERVLHFLAGVGGIDERLDALLEEVNGDVDLVTSHRAAVDRILTVWEGFRDDLSWPVVQVWGRDPDTARLVAAAACARIGMRLYALDCRDVPPDADSRADLARLCEREALLDAAAFLISCNDDKAPYTVRAVRAFVARLHAPVLLAAREPLPLGTVAGTHVELGSPTGDEQKALWRATLGADAAALNGHLERVVAQFDFGPARIAAAARESGTAGSLWQACRTVASPHLGDLAQRIAATAHWDDLVLPPEQVLILRAVAAQVRRRTTVYEEWGFASKSNRGLGIAALFAGPSGTGKTMAAEVLARELELDLFRIDLSSVVSKYIGETEKNLRSVFDAAEEGGAILLFDEADALFGKRSEVKDSHDRYANIEVSYLLQRMESYRGLAILTSNMKSALDQAFMRRLRFVVHFPFPGLELRKEIWRRVFPAEAPIGRLDFTKLARLNVAGGNIRNIALGAAFLAAEADEPVGMAHVLSAARAEYVKIEKPLTAAETGGWG